MLLTTLFFQGAKKSLNIIFKTLAIHMKIGLLKGGHFDLDVSKTRAPYHKNHCFYHQADAYPTPDPTPDMTITHKDIESY